MVSLDEMKFSTCLTPAVAFVLLISGSTFCAPKSLFGSVSTTKLFALIAGSVVNRSAASTWPFFSAVTVSGPPVSSTL